MRNGTRLLVAGLVLAGCSSSGLQVVASPPVGCVSLGAIKVSTVCRSTNLEVLAKCDTTIEDRVKSEARRRGADTVILGRPRSGQGEAFRCGARVSKAG